MVAMHSPCLTMCVGISSPDLRGFRIAILRRLRCPSSKGLLELLYGVRTDATSRILVGLVLRVWLAREEQEFWRVADFLKHVMVRPVDRVLVLVVPPLERLAVARSRHLARVLRLERHVFEPFRRDLLEY